MGKIKKAPLQKPSGKIHKSPLPENHIRFSFKYLEIDHPRFNVENPDVHYLKTLLTRLKDISSMDINSFRMAGKSLRSHPIDWNKTSEPDGFTIRNEQLRECTPWQFELTANKHGRVHGILVDELFYIIWFDPRHLLYPKH